MRRRRDGGDRVELEEAEPADGLLDAARAAVEELRPDRDAARLLERRLGQRSILSTPIARASRSSARSNAESRARASAERPARGGTPSRAGRSPCGRPSGRRARRAGRRTGRAARSNRRPARARACRPRSRAGSRTPAPRTRGPRACCRTARAARPPWAREPSSSAAAGTTTGGPPSSTATRRTSPSSSSPSTTGRMPFCAAREAAVLGDAAPR